MKKVMNLFTLMMVASAFSVSLRNLPMISQIGMPMIFFGVVAVLIYFIPIALVSAELATTFPKMGGITIWVKEAFGKKWGFFSIWLQWSYMNIGVIAMLYFISGSLAYVFAPSLVHNKIYLVFMSLFIIWLFTFFNLKGLKIASKISSVFFILGVLFPAVLLIVLSLLYLKSNNPILINTSFSKDNLLPNFKDFSTIIILIGFMRAFGGIEAAAVHANSVDNPKKNYPIAIGFVAVISFLINVLGSLSISLVIDSSDVSLIAGVMSTFSFYLEKYNLKKMVPLLGLLVALGQIGGFSTWIGGPVKGLLETAREGELPDFFKKINKNNAPINLLLIQAFIISISSTCFLIFSSNVNMAFWMSIALSMMIYFTMYFLMILSCLYLRYKKPDAQRAFKIPFKNRGIWFVSLLGMSSISFGYFVSFIPPSQLPKASQGKYMFILLSSLLVIYSIPLLIHKFKKQIK